LVGYGLLITGLLISDRPQRDGGVAPLPKINWVDRDAGQKLSMIMFHLIILTFAAAISWTMVRRIDAWYGPVLGAVALTAASWLTFRNWKNRDAR